MSPLDTIKLMIVLGCGLFVTFFGLIDLAWPYPAAEAVIDIVKTSSPDQVYIEVGQHLSQARKMFFISNILLGLIITICALGLLRSFWGEKTA